MSADTSSYVFGRHSLGEVFWKQSFSGTKDKSKKKKKIEEFCNANVLICLVSLIYSELIEGDVLRLGPSSISHNGEWLQRVSCSRGPNMFLVVYQ